MDYEDGAGTILAFGTIYPLSIGDHENKSFPVNRITTLKAV